MATFKLTLEYDGGGLVGWQRQRSGASIQALVEDAAAALDGRRVAATAAGRTDAGVHALGQVVGLALERAIEAPALVKALNARLPDSVRVVAAAEVPSSFHARFDARSKTYRYRIWNAEIASPFERRYAWHIGGALDVAAMDRAAGVLCGRRDFAAFQAAGRVPASSVRHVMASSVARGERSLITYDVIADGFLRHMVRNIVGTLVEVGRRRRPPEWMAEVLASRDRSRAGQTAPPEGLFLMRVEYNARFQASPSGTLNVA
jgi:tRNA pseudouridine38-40 synthase